MSIVPLPMWLRAWLALQVVTPVIGVLLDPGDPRLMRSVVWSIFLFLLGWAMWRHAKGAWFVAVFLGGGAVLGGLPALWLWTESTGPDFVWLAYGLAFGVADLAILLSHSARDWVSQPVQRKWNYAESNEGS